MPTCSRSARFVLGRGLSPCLSTRRIARRAFSSGHYHYEGVEVRCASSGSITVGLHNLPSHPPTAPLLIYIPPFSSASHSSPTLPAFSARYPTAVINYRWPEDTLTSDPVPASDPHQPVGIGGRQAAEGANGTPLHWPTPLHDTLFAYEWITKHLAPEGRQRRDVYVYGSYLGASLAASLALTESHTHERMAVRGVAIFNGVYDWTKLLPDHPSNQPSPSSPFRRGGVFSGEVASSVMSFVQDLENRDSDRGSAFHYIKQLAPTLFKAPSNLFDPFASPCLFFHSAGMLIPPTFEPSSMPLALLRAINELSLDEASTPAPGSPEAACLESTFKAPRKGYLVFPPRLSGLRVPETLLLHETAPRPLGGGRQRRRRRRGSTSARRKPGGLSGGSGHSFAAQATGLAGVMRRSVNMLELKERRKWDDEFDDWDSEAARRIRVVDVGGPERSDVTVEEAVDAWLMERMGL